MKHKTKIKLTIFLIILLLSACGKPQAEIPTVEQDTTVTETTLYTEAEVWLMFDEFWIEFQRAVVEGDTVRLREMCELSKKELYWFLNFIKNEPSIKAIKIVNKDNNYYCHTEYELVEIKYQHWKNDNSFQLNMNIWEYNVSGYFCDFELRNGKYKFVKFW